MELCCLLMKQVAQTILTDRNRDTNMPDERIPPSDPDQPMICHIRIEGHLGPHWSDWFEGLTITALDNGETLLTGPVIDQAALFGVLRKVSNLGMPVVSVVCMQDC